MKTKTNLRLLTLGILLSLANAGFAQPVITTQPQSGTNVAGTTASFRVEATGTPPLAYQWQRLSGIWRDLAGFTEPNLILSNVQDRNAGDYRVVITNVDGAITSDVAQLAVLVPPRITPTISLQNWALETGTDSSFVVAASGTEPLSFQWRLDGRDLVGETQNTLTLANLQPEDGGDYTVVVTNVAGAVTSEPARLWVVPPAADFIKSNFTNEFGVRLPYFYLLPANYTTERTYPLVLKFHGSGGDETVMTTPTGFLTYPRMKVFASYEQQEADPTILLWPARRAGDASSLWSAEYLQLTSSLLDQVEARRRGRVRRGSRFFGGRALYRFDEADLLGVDDLESPLLVVQQDGLPVRADHQVVGVGHHERLLVSQHNPNRSERLRMDQLFDLVGDHGAEPSPPPEGGQAATASARWLFRRRCCTSGNSHSSGGTSHVRRNG
jgi:hypothetical protein